ncbi:hypothetical protein BGZ83_007859 [Gryganskiella cystojenkinii]|nr:hypothetical protein BGZ83_007859 [Gryganskiella cystojenkinii]
MDNMIQLTDGTKTVSDIEGSSDCGSDGRTTEDGTDELQDLGQFEERYEEESEEASDEDEIAVEITPGRSQQTSPVPAQRQLQGQRCQIYGQTQTASQSQGQSPRERPPTKTNQSFLPLCLARGPNLDRGRSNLSECQGHQSQGPHHGPPERQSPHPTREQFPTVDSSHLYPCSPQTCGPYLTPGLLHSQSHDLRQDEGQHQSQRNFIQPQNHTHDLNSSNNNYFYTFVSQQDRDTYYENMDFFDNVKHRFHDQLASLDDSLFGLQNTSHTIVLSYGNYTSAYRNALISNNLYSPLLQERLEWTQHPDRQTEAVTKLFKRVKSEISDLKHLWAKAGQDLEQLEVLRDEIGLHVMELQRRELIARTLESVTRRTFQDTFGPFTRPESPNSSLQSQQPSSQPQTQRLTPTPTMTTSTSTGRRDASTTTVTMKADVLTPRAFAEPRAITVSEPVAVSSLPLATIASSGEPNLLAPAGTTNARPPSLTPTPMANLMTSPSKGQKKNMRRKNKKKAERDSLSIL